MAKRAARKQAAAWPADKIERRSLSSLLPYARNARMHSDAQVRQIAASIERWGWTMPILVDERDEIIAGHGRVMAATLLGLETVPVVVARGWSEDKRRAYVIGDNKLAEISNWDPALLAAELAELEAGGFDTLLTGFSDAEIAPMVGAAVERQESWGGMPEFEQHDAYGRRLKVIFRDQNAMERFASALGRKVTMQTIFLKYPENDTVSVADTRYEAAE